MTESEPDPQRDLSLVRRVIAREPAAMREFARRMRCVPRLVRRIRSRFGPQADSSEIDDLSQDVTLEVLRSLERYQGAGALEAWVHRISTYTVWRHLKRRKSWMSLDDVDMVTDPTSNPSKLTDAADSVAKMLQHLGGYEAQIVKHHLLEGLDFKRIAAQLGMPLATVRSHYYRGVARLRRDGRDGGTSQS